MMDDTETWLCGWVITDRSDSNRRTNQRVAGDASQTVCLLNIGHTFSKKTSQLTDFVMY